MSETVEQKVNNTKDAERYRWLRDNGYISTTLEKPFSSWKDSSHTDKMIDNKIKGL